MDLLQKLALRLSELDSVETSIYCCGDTTSRKASSELAAAYSSGSLVERQAVNSFVKKATGAPLCVFMGKCKLLNCPYLASSERTEVLCEQEVKVVEEPNATKDS